MVPPEKSITRRKFFKWLSATGIGSAVLGIQAHHAQGRIIAEKSDNMQMKVPTRPFGKTGVHLPILSLGGILIPGRTMS